MIYYVTDKNLQEYNRRLKKEGAGIKYIFTGFRNSSGVGFIHQTRHYIAEITEGENKGATTGQEIEIIFNAEYDHTDIY